MAESAWVEYEAHHKPKPVVPEPATYGLCLICIVLIILLIRKTKK